MAVMAVLVAIGVQLIDVSSLVLFDLALFDVMVLAMKGPVSIPVF